jgi:hypothetical protein
MSPSTTKENESQRGSVTSQYPGTKMLGCASSMTSSASRRPALSSAQPSSSATVRSSDTALPTSTRSSLPVVPTNATNSLAASTSSLEENTPHMSVHELTNGSSPSDSTGRGATPQSMSAASSSGIAVALSVMLIASWPVARISVVPMACHWDSLGAEPSATIPARTSYMCTVEASFT